MRLAVVYSSSIHSNYFTLLIVVLVSMDRRAFKANKILVRQFGTQLLAWRTMFISTLVRYCSDIYESNY